VRKRHRINDMWIFDLFFRDQEVEGSNPFAPTTSKTLPFIGLRYLLLFEFFCVLWTIVDQLKTQTDALRPFLPERHILFEL
jgi:hypothetical protein